MTEAFVNQIEKEMAERKNDILQLRVIAERADPDRQIECYQIIEGIVARENAVREKLARIADTEPKMWPSLQKEIEEQWGKTVDAIEVAKAKILEL